MNLTSWSNLVKPDRLVMQVALASAALTLLGVLLVLSLTDPQRGRMDRLGTATAQMLAGLAVEPLLAQDRMHLGVIGNRLMDIPEVAGVASYTADDQLLALAGDVQGHAYIERVTLDDALIGYVQVALRPQAFADDAQQQRRALGFALVALLAPLLLAMSWTLAGAARRGELPDVSLTPAWLTRLASADRAAPPGSRPAAGEPEPPAPPEICHYLLAVNLYNQLSLQSAQRDIELSLCFDLAHAVSGLYEARVERLPGIGVLIDFDDTGDDDRGFDVVCAALLLGRLLRDESPYGTYRLGLHLVHRPADQALPTGDPAVADATLLSALAKDATLALSEPAMEAIGNTSRLVSRPLHNPLLEELTQGSAGCHLVAGLAPEHEERLADWFAEQAEQFRRQRPSTASESTF